MASGRHILCAFHNLLRHLAIALAKWAIFIVLTIGPVFILLTAAPALAAYGVMAGALMARRGKGGFLIILISAPFLIPILIFGLAAVDSYLRFGILAFEFRALAGLSLIAMAIGLPAASAALTANIE